jgi:hypothetical protein
LPDRAGALSFNARSRKARLGARALDQRIANLKHILGDGLEKPGAFLQTGRSVRMKGLPSQLASAINFFAAREGEGWFKGFARGWVYGSQVALFAGNRLRADKDISTNHLNLRPRKLRGCGLIPPP